MLPSDFEGFTVYIFKKHSIHSFFFFFCFQLLVVHGLVLRPEGMCSGLVVIKTRQNLWISADTGR